MVERLTPETDCLNSNPNYLPLPPSVSLCHLLVNTGQKSAGKENDNLHVQARILQWVAIELEKNPLHQDFSYLLLPPRASATSSLRTPLRRARLHCPKAPKSPKDPLGGVFTQPLLRRQISSWGRSQGHTGPVPRSVREQLWAAWVILMTTLPQRCFRVWGRWSPDVHQQGSGLREMEGPACSSPCS